MLLVDEKPVYISYAGGEKTDPLVKKIVGLLNKENIQSFEYKTNIQKEGHERVVEYERTDTLASAIADGDTIIMVLDEKYITESLFCIEEIGRIVSRNELRLKDVVFPIAISKNFKEKLHDERDNPSFVAKVENDIETLMEDSVDMTKFRRRDWGAFINAYILLLDELKHGISWVSFLETEDDFEKFIRKIKKVVAPKSNSKLYSTVPSLLNESEYLERDELRDIKASILGKDTKIGITSQSKKVGLHGMGGIGKTVSAIALAHDPEIREYFRDGIYYVSLGQNPDIGEKQSDLLYEGFDIDESKPSTSKLREAFADKKILLILDNVWERKHLESFNVLSRTSKLLITTRQQDILDGASMHTIDILTPDQSMKLLENKAGNISEVTKPIAEEILKRCGYLPLAVSMIGATLNGRDVEVWKNILTKLEKSKLDKIKLRSPENEEHESLFKVIDISVEYLSEDIKEKYLSLSIFADNEIIRDQTLKNYWGEEDYLDYALALADASLLKEEEDYTSRIVYKLHDLQKDYLKLLETNVISRYKDYIDRYKNLYENDWSKISTFDTFFYNNYIGICNILGIKELSKNIAKDLLHKQPYLNIKGVTSCIDLLNCSKEEVFEKLLKINNNNETLVWILSQLGSGNIEVQNFAKEYIIQDKDQLNGKVTTKCLNVLDSNSEVVQNFAKEYIAQDKDRINSDTTTKCLNVLDDNSEVVQNFAKEYITQDKDQLNGQVTTKCLNVLDSNSEVVQNFAKEYIAQDKDRINSDTTTKCLNVLDDNSEVVQNFAKEYIAQDKDRIDSDIATKCLNVLDSNSEVVQNFAKEYIAQDKDRIDSDIATKCLNVLDSNSEVVQNFAKEYIAQDKDRIDSSIATKCLNVLNNECQEAMLYAENYIKIFTPETHKDIYLLNTALSYLPIDNATRKEFAERALNDIFDKTYGLFSFPLGIQAQVYYTLIDDSSLREKSALKRLNSIFNKNIFSQHYKYFIDSRSMLNACLLVFESNTYSIQEYCVAILENYESELSYHNKNGRFFHRHIVTALQCVEFGIAVEKAKIILAKDNELNAIVLENKDKEYTFMSYVVDDAIHELIKEDIAEQKGNKEASENIYRLLEDTYSIRKKLATFNEHKITGLIQIVNTLSYLTKVHNDLDVAIKYKKYVVSEIKKQYEEKQNDSWKEKLDLNIEELAELNTMKMELNK